MCSCSNHCVNPCSVKSSVQVFLQRPSVSVVMCGFACRTVQYVTCLSCYTEPSWCRKCFPSDQSVPCLLLPCSQKTASRSCRHTSPCPVCIFSLTSCFNVIVPYLLTKYFVCSSPFSYMCLMYRPPSRILDHHNDLSW